jgi:dTDP-4-amino-4,6-dideoxygalactose transaminase
LAHLDAWNARRRAIAAQYIEQLRPIVRPVPEFAGTTSVWHLFVVEADERDAYLQALADHDIGAGLHYAVPCHLQPGFALYHDSALPTCERTARRILSLPMHPFMTDADVDSVCDVVARVSESVQPSGAPIR